jgi:unsaturated rhamnogalacturonyl hydrolase
MKKTGIIFFLVILLASATNAQDRSYATELANTAIRLWPDSFALKAGQPAKWSYDQGVILKGIEGLWNRTGEGRWFNYIQKSMDFYVQDDGRIRGYKTEEYNLDNINNGKLLLMLYQVTGKEKYKKAVDLLRNQLKTHPRNSEGGFWHKKVYPGQMWLDGLYMAEPFYAEYAKLFHEDTAFNDIARQFILIDRYTRDANSGLYYHGWDETKQQKWADKQTGLSPNVWGRALGWYGMAMVDALDYFPEHHQGRDSIINILNRFATAVIKVQDAKTGLWYDVPNLPAEPKNYFEASASSMLVYTLAKGVRKGYLPAAFLKNAKKGYDGILKQFIKTENGQSDLAGTVSVSGLGGNPYRDGSFAYYMSEPVIVNDPKGLGAFINAANEMELLPTLQKGKGKTVLLDYYFNNEWKKDATGKDVRYHYTWDDRANSGFSMLGEVFHNYGVRTDSLTVAPTKKNLKGAHIYIIVDPDTEKETAHPHFMDKTSADAIAEWVKDGGVLILMANDAGNAELKNFNLLSSKFGITFNEDNYNLVQGNQFEQGAVMIREGNWTFPSAKKIYVKELATLNLQGRTSAVVSKEGKNVIATARYGKGSVFAIGDPWLYNEYVDGRKLPADFDNYKAAQDLVKWSVDQTKKK